MIETVGGSANCLPPGVQIGEYRLLDVIGEGGFGIVYRARDISLDRIVAIKEYMPATLAGRKSSNEIHVRSQHRGAFDAGLRSFINEARLLAKFSHPALVHVYRFFEFNGTAYMVMRHYEGQTFRAFLSAQHDRMNQRMLSAIVSPVLDVVEMLHAADCYHRDIAPDNVFLQNSGMPVLLDFGAARRIIGDMTQALTMVLKPGFAPIEQYVDDGAMPQGAWTDIYQIGAMLYLAITGKPPATSVARMINDPVITLTPANYAGYSPRFLHGVHRALAVKPQDRPQTIAELKDLLGITTFTSPMLMPWGNAAPASLAEASADTPEPKPSRPTPAQDSSTAFTTATLPATPQDTQIDWGQFGKTSLGGAPSASVAIDERPHEAAPLAPAAPDSSRNPVGADGKNSAVSRSSESTPGRPGRATETRSNEAAPVASDPRAVFPAQATVHSAPPVLEKPRASRNAGVTRWLAAIAAAVVATSTLAVWWGGRDTSAGTPSAETHISSDEQHWRQATATGTIAALDAYLDAQPAGKYRGAALASISRLEAAETSLAAEPPPAPAETAAVTTSALTPERTAAPGPTSLPHTATAAGGMPTPIEPASAAKATAKAAGDIGQVALRISPWGRVSVNGNSVGTTPPLKQLELPEGTHRIEVSNPAATSVIRTVQVKKGEPVVISHQFE